LISNFIIIINVDWGPHRPKISWTWGLMDRGTRGHSYWPWTTMKGGHIQLHTILTASYICHTSSINKLFKLFLLPSAYSNLIN